MQSIVGNKNLCNYAAEKGRIDILQQVHEQEPLIFENYNDFATIASQYGHLNVLEFFKNNNIEFDVYTCAKIAAEYGFLHIIQWLHQNGCDPNYVHENSWTCCGAASGGHLHILQWLRNHGYQWDRYTCFKAAGNGHLHVLQWARENGCPWDEETCNHAARYGHLHILQWARQEGCPWNKATCSYAAENGYLQILQWARKNGCPWNEYEICKFAYQYGHLHILHWALTNGCKLLFGDYSYIFYVNHLPLSTQLNMLNWVLNWVKDHNLPPANVKKIFNMAIQRKKIYIAKFLLENKHVDFVNVAKFLQTNVKEISKLEFNRIQDVEWFHEMRLKAYDFKFKKFRSKIDTFNTALLNVIEVPDLVKLIKSYI